MLKKHYYLALLLLLFYAEGYTQNPHIDSLYFLEDKEKDIKAKIKIIHRIVASTWDYDLEKAHQEARRAYDLAKQIEDSESLAITLTDIGMYYYFVGNYSRASNFYRQAISETKGKSFGEFPAYTYTRIGNLYRVQGLFDSASYYYEKTLENLKDVPTGIAESSVYFHMGWLQYDLSQYRQALPLLYKALDIRSSIGDSLLIAECWRVIGTVHLGMNQFDSAVYYLNRVMALAKRYNDIEMVTLTSINLGDLHFARSDLLESIKAYQEALDHLQHHGFKRFRALVLHHIGLVFNSQGDYLKAIEYLLNALKLSEELNSRQEIIKINGAIGWTFSSLNNSDKAYEFATKALSLSRQSGDKATIAFCQNLLGNIYFNRKHYESALIQYDSALRYRTELGLDLLVVNTMYNMAMVYEARGMLDKALEFLLKDLVVAEATLNLRTQALANNAIGLVYGRKGDFKKAEQFLNQGLAVAMRIGAPINKRDSYYNFAKVYTLAGQHQKANRYYEKYIATNDSIVNRESLLSSLQMNALYQLDKKEQELTALASENALNQARINVQQTDLRFKNFVLIISIAGIVLLAAGGVVLYRYYREKSSSHKALEKLNREISEQKEEIQAQSEELMEANESLSKLNYDLLEKQEEIEAQSEELREANETISEINRGLESVVNRRTGQLKEAYKELDTFFYRSSHDFRRPLTTFLGLAEVAKITVKDANALELFDKVRETATNLDKMLLKLQSISDVGAQQLVYKEVFLADIFHSICDSFREELARASIKTSIEVDLKDTFYSYPAMIRIIIENLVENAIHFRRPNDPWINVRVSQNDGRVVMDVSDNGQGIDGQLHGQIFEMYFRGNDRSKGNGLGLYIVKKAVEKLNGNLSVKSTVGEGTTFTAYLPMESGTIRLS